MTTYKELTEYPKIFKYYWGNFTVNKHGLIKNKEDQIIINRNQFIKEFKIKQKAGRYPKMRLEMIYLLRQKLNSRCYEFDHTEFYKTENDELVIVNSPYHEIEDSKYWEYMESVGWRKYNKLYMPTAHTYIIVIPFSNVRTKSYKQIKELTKKYINI